MQSNLEFVTDGSKVYRLGGNDWYAVEQDDDKVMLIDTDCKIDDEELKTPWSNGYCRSKDGENGQCILDYINNIADKYFSGIKHAIEPRSVEAGTSKLEDAYMWPMSYEEFGSNKVIGGKIACNSGNGVWTRTFSIGNSIYRYAWRVRNSNGDLGNLASVDYLYNVAPAFYLRKSLIDRINEDNEIVLKPEDNVN